jgi:nucleoside-diphosphate-sugar epimerase
VLDREELARAARGCSAIVHLAAIPHDTLGSPEQILAVNVLGTGNVLLAAEAAGAETVVNFSSFQVLGVSEGERAARLLPDRRCASSASGAPVRPLQAPGGGPLRRVHDQHGDRFAVAPARAGLGAGRLPARQAPAPGATRV